MKHKLIIISCLVAVASLTGFVLLRNNNLKLSGVSVFMPIQGGTGTSTPSGILYGDNGATQSLQTLVIGSNLTLAGNTLSAAGGGGLSGLSPNALVYATSPTAVSATSAPSVSFIMATSSNATSTFIGGANFAVLGGNVGIGTSTPPATLSITDVGGTFPTNSTTLGQMSTRIQINHKATVVGAGAGLSFAGFSSRGNGIYASIDAIVTGNSSATGSTGDVVISTKSSSVATTLTEAMRIKGTGLIGMGTSSPTIALTVDSSTNGTVWIDPNTTYNGVAFGGKRGAAGWSGGFSFIGNSAGGNTALGGFNAIGGSALTRFVIGTVTTNELVSILAAGNVGIGTTTPAQKLEVYKTSGDLYSRLDANQSTADVGYILNNSGSNANSWAVKRNNTLGTFSINRSSATFPTTGTITQPFTINTTDNVGIGTTTMFSQNTLTIANSSGSQISLVDGGTAPVHWDFRALQSGDLAFATSSPLTGATSTPNAMLLCGGSSPACAGFSIGATTTTPVAYGTFEMANNPRTYQFYVGSSTKTSLVIDNAGAMFAPNTASSGATQTGYWCYDGSGQFVRDSTACLVSAERFKTKIATLDSGINELLKLRPVSYFKKNPLDKADSYEQIGFIAEEAEKVDSRLISYGNDGTIRGFRYDQFTALITKAIQDIWHKITGYDQKIAKLEKDNAELKARLDKLEKKINGK